MSKLKQREVCVITGGGSGMGLAAAKCMAREKIIVLTGRTMSKLEKAVRELEALGFEAHAKACDTSVRAQVRELADYAADLGKIRNVIHCAGLSPAMADPEARQCDCGHILQFRLHDSRLSGQHNGLLSCRPG